MLSALGLTQADLVRATGASEYKERLRDVLEVALVLQDSLTQRGVGQWLNARNRMLGGRRPLELIRAGDPATVKEAAQAFVDGAYV